MAHLGGRQVVAIGLDAAEASLVREMIDGDALPHLAELLRDGSWGKVTSPADIGSGAVWPTFSTGLEPEEHGLYSLWGWDPGRMQVSPVAVDALLPFWGQAVRDGLTVGVIDVPFAPQIGLRTGGEILEWGSHDWVRRKTVVAPAALRNLVQSCGGSHPFAARPLDAWSSVEDDSGRATIACQCIDGARRRGTLAAQLLSREKPQLMLVVFSEVHRASHVLWHTVDPDRPRVSDAGPAPSGSGPSLRDVYTELDGQVGRIIAQADAEATILVFSLHGMRATGGIPTILDPLLQSLGFASLNAAEAVSGPARARQLMGSARRHAPHQLRTLYHRITPPATVLRLAGPPLPIPDYDWSRTTAFALPTDQHGWIRLNLAGREAKGIVDPGSYEDTCQLLERTLLELRGVNGRPLVRRVLRPGGVASGIPDLVVHWDEAADPTRVSRPCVSAGLRASNLTGQHAPDGFFLVRGPAATRQALGAATNASALGRIILESLGH